MLATLELLSFWGFLKAFPQLRDPLPVNPPVKYTSVVFKRGFRGHVWRLKPLGQLQNLV